MKLPDTAEQHASFHTAAGSILKHPAVISNGITAIYNRLSPSSSPRQTLVFSAPHLGRAGLEDLGLLKKDGSLIDGVPMHRVTDVNLDRLVAALVNLSGYTVVGAHFSRLVVNAAVPAEMAVMPETPDGVPIPAYQNGYFNEQREAALKLHKLYDDALGEQIRLGGTFVGSLDTFTPEHLAGDFCGQRDMAISIIATNDHRELAEQLKQHFSTALLPQLNVLQKETGHYINGYEPVAINKPYGEQMHHRLADLLRGGITIEVRNDLLENDQITAIIAQTLYDGIEKVYGQRPQPDATAEQRGNPSAWQKSPHRIDITN